jgi:hypothetical protein
MVGATPRSRYRVTCGWADRTRSYTRMLNPARLKASFRSQGERRCPGEARPLRRSEPFLFRPERIPAKPGESAVRTLSPVPYARKEPRLSRGFLASSKLEVKHSDCVAERGGFEPPRPFGNRWAEFCPSLAHNLALKEESMLERIGSLTIRLFFGSLVPWLLGQFG